MVRRSMRPNRSARLRVGSARSSARDGVADKAFSSAPRAGCEGWTSENRGQGEAIERTSNYGFGSENFAPERDGDARGSEWSKDPPAGPLTTALLRHSDEAAIAHASPDGLPVRAIQRTGIHGAHRQLSSEAGRYSGIGLMRHRPKGLGFMPTASGPACLRSHAARQIPSPLRQRKPLFPFSKL